MTDLYFDCRGVNPRRILWTVEKVDITELEETTIKNTVEWMSYSYDIAIDIFKTWENGLDLKRTKVLSKDDKIVFIIAQGNNSSTSTKIGETNE